MRTTEGNGAKLFERPGICASRHTVQGSYALMNT